MNWFYFSLLTAILWGACYASTEQIAKTFPIKPYLVFSCFLSGVCFLIWSSLDGTINEVSKQSIYKSYPWILTSSVASFFACFLSVQAVKYGGATLASIIEISYPVWVVLFLFLFTGVNTLSLNTLVGGALIFLGTIVTLRK